MLRITITTSKVCVVHLEFDRVLAQEKRGPEPEQDERQLWKQQGDLIKGLCGEMTERGISRLCTALWTVEMACLLYVLPAMGEGSQAGASEEERGDRCGSPT